MEGGTVSLMCLALILMVFSLVSLADPQTISEHSRKWGWDLSGPHHVYRVE